MATDANEQLFKAAATGNLDRLQAALAAGADADAPLEGDGRTPLVMAARCGHVDGIRALLTAGADPGAPAGWFGSPLRHAAAEGHLDAVRALVEAGAPLVSRSEMEGPILPWAVESDDPEIVRFLVSAGADLNAMNRAQQTALHVCAVTQKPRAAAALLELGADPSASDGDRTPLEWAQANDDAAMIALLTGTVSAETTAGEPEHVPDFRYAAPSGEWLEVEGIKLSEQFDLTAFVQRLLAGREALGLSDHYPYDRLQRLWNRMAGVLDGLSRAVAECLGDPSPLVRSQALMFFRERPATAGAERVEELAESPREAFAGVVDPIHRDVDLEHGLLAALGARAKAGSWRASELAKRIVLEPGKAEPLLIFVPREHLLEHAEAIARTTPVAGAYLIGLLIQEGRDWRPLLAAAAAHPDFATRLEWHVTDEVARARILESAQEPVIVSCAQVARCLGQPESEERSARLYDLGVSLFETVGGDRPLAFDWMARAFTAAAESGHAQSWVELGRCRWNGWGVPESRVAGLEAYEKAAALGSHYGAYVAAHNLYWVFGRDEEAFRYVQQSLAGSDPEGEAHYLAGLMAFNGRGREKDEAESFRLHDEAARRGNADALFELHIFYAKGIACQPDPQRAAENLRRAAEKGQRRACYNMGAFHATGSTPPFEKDVQESVRWYTRAAELGHGKAAATLAAMHLTGEDLPADSAVARKWADRAIELGFDVEEMLTALDLELPDPEVARQREELFERCKRAIRDGDVAAVRAALDAGLPADSVGGDYNISLLTTAAQQGDPDVIEALVTHGADPNRENDAPLVLALRSRHFEAAERLLKLGADVNHDNDFYRCSLNSFTSDDQIEMVRWLLDHGADPNRPARSGETALMAAAKDGQTALVKLLLGRGADPNASKDIDFGLGVVTKDSALKMAEHYGHSQIVAALKAAGARE